MNGHDGTDRVDAALRGLGQRAPELPPLGAALEAELGALAPVKTRRPLRDVAVVAAVALVYGGAISWYFTLRRDLPALPLGWVVGYGAAWLASFGGLLWLAMVPRPGAMMPRWRHAGIAAVIASTGFIVAGLLFHPATPQSFLYEPTMHNHLHYGAPCLEIGTLTAMAPVVVGALLLRGVVPVGARWTAAALGAAGGSVGGLMLHLHCPIANPIHIGLSHGGVVLISALLAALLVPAADPLRRTSRR